MIRANVTFVDIERERYVDLGVIEFDSLPRIGETIDVTPRITDDRDRPFTLLVSGVHHAVVRRAEDGTDRRAATILGVSIDDRQGLALDAFIFRCARRTAAER